MLAFGAVNAQGWFKTYAKDDFKTATNYVNGPNQEGVYWFENTTGTSLVLTRPADGEMTITAKAAGGCTVAGCYPIFGANFGTVNSLPVTLDLTSGANVTIDIENTVNKFTFITVILQDSAGTQAIIEPNVSDLKPGTMWADAPRKSLNGLSFGDPADPSVNAKLRKTVTIDLSSVAGAIGGLTAGTYDCDPAVTYPGGYKGGPATCPTTTYKINPKKITNVLFQVNFGHDNIFVSEGSDYTSDTFIPGTAITPYTGAFKMYKFQVGGTLTGINENVVKNSLSVYPNPAKDLLNVAFESTNGATVSLTDIVGHSVYSSAVHAGMSNLSVNTAELSSGMYILNVTTESGTVSSKVIK